MPPKLNFSKEMDYRLIDLVECKPFLWDCTSEIYKRADLKNAAWEEIAKQLGSHLTGSIISNRFKNIKDTFARNLRIMKESKRSGAGTDNLYKPKWHLFERLMFLKKTCVQGESESNISSIQLQTELSQSNDSISCTEDSSLVNVYYDDALQKYMLIPHEAINETDSQTDQSFSSAHDFEPITVNAPQSEICVPSQSVTTVTNKRPSEQQLFCKRGSKTKKSATLMEEAVDVLKQFCQTDSSPASETLNDSAHTLALFIESRLRLLSPEKRKQCEDEILKLLTMF